MILTDFAQEIVKKKYEIEKLLAVNLIFSANWENTTFTGFHWRNTDVPWDNRLRISVIEYPFWVYMS
jgi:hypothetical protein